MWPSQCSCPLPSCGSGPNMYPRVGLILFPTPRCEGPLPVPLKATVLSPPFALLPASRGQRGDREKGPGRISCSIGSSCSFPQALNPRMLSPESHCLFWEQLVESAEKSLQADIKLPLHVQPPWTSYSLASPIQHPSISSTMPAKSSPVPRVPAPGKQVLMALSAGTWFSLVLQVPCNLSSDGFKKQS